MQLWHARDRTLTLDRPLVMGILNVTPDSFSDGGRFASVEEAVAHGVAMREAGADVIDVGGESTRPQGAQLVDASEEARRILPVIRTLASRLPDSTISVDTVKAEVARQALEAGAHVVNDVSGFRLDPRMGEICATARAGVVLMHSRGTVSDMGTFAHANYQHLEREVFRELRASLQRAEAAGVEPSRIAVDPGIGFAKRSEHSLRLLAALPELVTWGYPVVVGVSRKRFIGEITGVTEAAGRVHGSVGASVAALALGARVFRVHDVAAHRQALDAAWEVLRRTNAGEAMRA